MLNSYNVFKQCRRNFLTPLHFEFDEPSLYQPEFKFVVDFLKIKYHFHLLHEMENLSLTSFILLKLTNLLIGMKVDQHFTQVDQFF